MKQSTCRTLVAALFVTLTCSAMPALAAGGGKASYVTPTTTARISDRLIVKFKANNLSPGLNVAEIHAQLSQPLTVQTMSQLQAAAGAGLTELQATQNGAHILAVAGQPNRQTLNAAIAGIRSLKNIEYVEEDYILTEQAVPNDTYYTSAISGGVTYPGLWGMWPVTTVASPAPGSTGSYGADFETAWASSTGTGVVVAVIDTGITANLDIVGPGAAVAAGVGSNLISSGYDFITDCRTRASCPAATADLAAVVAASPDATDLGNWITAQDKIDNPNWSTATVADSNWHGTHVAGTIAALGNNNKGVIGGAYNAKILPVRALGKGGGVVSDISNAILWAAGVHSTIANPNPAKVINMSLGGAGACSITMQNAINLAVAAGAVVVVAAGNSNADVANYMPANCTNVISVGAIARDGTRAAYSNFSSPASNTINPVNLTLAAQGGDQVLAATYDPGILSTIDSGLTVSAGTVYNWKQGTSMATPHVAAAAALMLSRNPNLTPAQIKTVLSSTSSLTAFPSFVAGQATWDCSLNQNCGAGILNANLALQNSTPTVTAAAATSDFGSIMTNGNASRTITLTNGWMFPAQAGTASITGTNASLFSISSDTCSGFSIAAGGTCQISVSYAPTAMGAHVASLAVPFSDATSSTLVSLNGTSLVTLTTSDVTAPSVTLGNSTSVTLSYTNPNAGTVGIGAISLSQPSIMAASLDNCSNTTLAGGASCTVKVTITPAAAGSYSGTASLNLLAGGAATVATISGSAAAAPSSGGGGCSVMPFGAQPDMSLLFALLALAAYGLGRRVTRKR
ncbi:MAG: S8 family serine peptidase [Sideroxydans sp.]|nr:S8 family serine peptidase [Sideroxydans sp.]